MTYKLFGTHSYSTPLTIFSNESRLVSDSINLRRRAVLKLAQRFEFLITIEEGTNSTLHADLMANWFDYGMETPFYIPCPQHLYTDAGTTGVSVITVSTNYTAGSVAAIALTSSHLFSFPVGRLITFSNHTKLYSVTAAIVAVYNAVSGLYEASMTVRPSLVAAIDNTTIVAATGVNAYVLNEADNSSFEYSDGIIQGASLKFIEYL